MEAGVEKEYMIRMFSTQALTIKWDSCVEFSVANHILQKVSLESLCLESIAYLDYLLKICVDRSYDDSPAVFLRQFEIETNLNVTCDDMCK